MFLHMLTSGRMTPGGEGVKGRSQCPQRTWDISDRGEQVGRGKQFNMMWTLVFLSSITASLGVKGDERWQTSGSWSSCRYYCDYTFSDCSCSSSCIYYGNCCHDYYRMCSAITTQGITTSTATMTTSPGNITTAQKSCRYNCGYHLGDCSCSSSCEYYGNCCYDYYRMCGSSTTSDMSTSTAAMTTSTAATTTAQSSCRYYCGYTFSDCSCSSSCEYYGNCCHDYHRMCSAITTTRPATSTGSWSSCRYNCGYTFSDCSCSSSCEYYGNCCHDYHRMCGSSTTPDTSTSTATMTTSTAAPTTGSWSSCRYNCGYTFSDCSCSSSCRYYGNCCHDYHRMCGSSTTPGITTTAQKSCRYNCGYHLGDCSCSSSCEYYGNCCYDYYRMCNRTTIAPTQPTSEEYISCRYQCGREFSLCSCSSSCEYRHNCCHDYYSYCRQSTTPYWSTTSSANTCGKTLYGSGIFTSPNHPNYYDSNTYCSTVLRTSHDQQIFLEFTFLEIENCCSCDYIEVYDGPSTNSRYLGKVCNNSLSTFSSSSNYMTVLFRTDGSVVGRGFTAQFSSSVSPRSGRVNCSSYGMEIVIERSYLNSIGYNASSLYLDDNTCRPQITSRQVIFRYSLNSCGNVRKFHNGKAMYSNNVRAYNSSISGEVTRLSHFKLNVACLMEQESLSQIMYVVKSDYNNSLIGSGRFNTTMRFYDSNNFYYPVTEFPYMVSLNQYLNTEVRLDRAESDFVLFLDTCVASPSPDDFSYRPYYLVRNGCNMDSTFQVWSTSSYYVRFRFKAFQFLRASESVYLQCKVVICYTNDSNSRCRKGCMRRKKRSLSPGDKSHTVVLGPIKLKETEEKEEKEVKDQPQETV